MEGKFFFLTRLPSRHTVNLRDPLPAGQVGMTHYPHPQDKLAPLATPVCSQSPCISVSMYKPTLRAGQVNAKVIGNSSRHEFIPGVLSTQSIHLGYSTGCERSPSPLGQVKIRPPTTLRTVSFEFISTLMTQ